MGYFLKTSSQQLCSFFEFWVLEWSANLFCVIISTHHIFSCKLIPICVLIYNPQNQCHRTGYVVKIKISCCKNSPKLVLQMNKTNNNKNKVNKTQSKTKTETIASINFKYCLSFFSRNLKFVYLRPHVPISYPPIFSQHVCYKAAEEDLWNNLFTVGSSNYDASAA